MSLLSDYKIKIAEIERVQEKIKPELDLLSALTVEAENIKSQIRAEVEVTGEQEGFGYKAYLQVRQSVTYIPEKFIAKFPKMADLVTEVVVNKEKIAGLLKGKILSEEELEDCREVKETKAFYLQKV